MFSRQVSHLTNIIILTILSDDLYLLETLRSMTPDIAYIFPSLGVNIFLETMQNVCQKKHLLDTVS